MNKILIIGATSAIAEEFARLCAAKGDQLFLVARNANKLKIVAADLKIRGAGKAEFFILDANDCDRHPEMLRAAEESLGGLDVVLIAHGSLPDQEKAELDYKLTAQEFQTNFLSAVSLLTLIAADFEKKGRGTIAVISSVAGDRGRQSNYIYGAAKGALSIYLAGLRGRLQKAGVAVVTIKPGFVDTPMTAHLKKGLLFASARQVASGIEKAIEKRRDVVYLPGFWLLIMTVIRLIPERVFKKLKL
jgi:decaprenylphospho-beta-D-erythro-pentofuranosid-2-ulose 2-reductase